MHTYDANVLYTGQGYARRMLYKGAGKGNYGGKKEYIIAPGYNNRSYYVNYKDLSGVHEYPQSLTGRRNMKSCGNTHFEYGIFMVPQGVICVADGHHRWHYVNNDDNKGNNNDNTGNNDDKKGRKEYGVQNVERLDGEWIQYYYQCSGLCIDGVDMWAPVSHMEILKVRKPLMRWGKGGKRYTRTDAGEQWLREDNENKNKNKN